MGVKKLTDLAQTEATSKITGLVAECEEFVLLRRSENNQEDHGLDLHFTIEFLMTKIVTLEEKIVI